MDIKPITLKIPIKKYGKTNNKGKVKNLQLEGQVELKKDCLKYFHGCWVKCIKKSGEYNSGGFLTKLTYDIAYLRSLQYQELLEFNIHEHRFYVKKDSEQYIAMQQIELEKERLTIETINLKNKQKKLSETERTFCENKKHFNIEKEKFEKVRDNFFELFRNGKVKILI